MQQQSFTDLEYANRKRSTKRDEFLAKMDALIPWGEWEEQIKPVYFKNTTGRPPRGIETMLRMFLLQSWFNLSDEAVEDTIYDSYAFRRFMKLDFLEEQAPDATTLCKFRKILVDNNIGKALFESINSYLVEQGHLIRNGSIVDATIIEAPTSTKNKDKARDPEMHSAKKGSQWHFGMKTHIGVDCDGGYVHTVTATPANVHDVTEAHKLIDEEKDKVVYGDSGYLGLSVRDEIMMDSNKFLIDFQINARPGKYRKLPEGPERESLIEIERRKSAIRAKVEFPFLAVKKTFGFRKTVYRGIAKNLHRLHILFCTVNLLRYARASGWKPLPQSV